MLAKLNAPADCGCDAPNAGVELPKRLAALLCAPKPPPNKLGVLAAPKAGVLAGVPPNKLGVLAAPKAGVLAAPKAGVLAAPKLNAIGFWLRPNAM